MNFEWDDQKSDTCFDQRGFDFLFVTKAFFDQRRVVIADERRSYGEHRYKLFVTIEKRLFVVIYTLRQDTVRIISACKANQREVKFYENSTRDS